MTAGLKDYSESTFQKYEAVPVYVVPKYTHYIKQPGLTSARYPKDTQFCPSVLSRKDTLIKALLPWVGVIAVKFNSLNHILKYMRKTNYSACLYYDCPNNSAVCPLSVTYRFSLIGTIRNFWQGADRVERVPYRHSSQHSHPPHGLYVRPSISPCLPLCLTL